MELSYRQDQEVGVTVLNSPGFSTRGRIRGVAGRQIFLMTDEAVSRGSLVEIEWDHYLLLGEVRESDQEGRDLAVEVEHALSQIETLRNRRQIWLNPPPSNEHLRTVLIYA